MTSSTNFSSPANLLSFSSGSSFIDFTALTNLIGSTAAESLILGNHGAGGVAWATTSAFGLAWVIRACISGATPGWLRETIGIRTPVSETAVGMELSSDALYRVAAKARENNTSGPLGFTIEASEALHRLDEKHARRWSNRIQLWKEVYAFNLQMSQLLSKIPDTKIDSPSVATYTPHIGETHDRDQGTSLPMMRKNNHTLSPVRSEQSSLYVHTYAPYTFYRRHNPGLQISVLTLSALKLGEFFALRVYGAPLLGIVAIIPWLYFFSVAVFLEVRELYLACTPEEVDGHLDILVGQLPSLARPGGARKIIIGAPRNHRTSVWWRLIWAVGAFICTSSMILTYMLMRQQTGNVIFVWAGFQVAWMIARTFVYHIAEPTDVVAGRMLVQRPWDTLPDSVKARTLELMLACAQYQALVHPRGPSLYDGDSFTSSELASIFIDTPLKKHYPLPDGGRHDHVTVNVSAVVGDTTLASAAWITGRNELTPIDLYDCCIISLSVKFSSNSTSPAQLIAVPAVRFFSGASITVLDASFDIETNPIPQFIPKGAPNTGYGTWWYYVPCENGLWLLIKREAPNTIIGKQTAEIVDDAQITATLSKGNINISLTHVDEVKRTAEFSEMGRQAIMQLLVR